MRLEDIYKLGQDHGMREALHVRLRESVVDPRTIDPYAIVRAECIPKGLVFEHTLGDMPEDLIGTGYPCVRLLSGRFFSLLRQEGFTGWITFPVEVCGKTGARLDDYWGFAVTGRCGPLDDSKSPVVWQQPRNPRGKPRQVRVGMLFDMTTWDGSDIFVPQGTGAVFVVERVKEAVERAGMTNVRFRRITEIAQSIL